MSVAAKIAAMETLGERARHARKARKLTQVDLAGRISKLTKEKVTQESISQLESDSVVDPRYLVEMAEVLRISLQWLKSGRGQMEQSGNVATLRQDRLDPSKLARVLGEIQDYERENKLEFSNSERAHLIKKLYSQPDNIDYRAEIADVIELSQAMRRP